ncbi:unnamed protein product [Nakaseomyces glabratus]|uniref:Telomere replication protein EST3 n=2 Tax=Candida glabrata TaxID=5478 RepID=EST3_CANGA|nr:LOW QUALITY PROTEIN: uncharacterized protein CAGL0C03828g [Nakaseomyces glabratus]Q6FWQ2.1 RecName: Full=Telomere replication protein EST3 [Nakaseomyces glabratus CBS 138]CAG58248.1 unnamed protein product [Nakaseomyces glabratus]|eukprot:XP_445342.1 LOW QUALITY PROTEIN: uncharacterized protein CAGL0C03828g [[Candida] glabrata]
MPPFIPKSRSNAVESVYLHGWVRDMLLESKTSQNIAVIPRVDPDEASIPLLSRRIYANRRHFVKITKFFQVHNYSVYASVKDSQHQILSQFTPKCVSEFESRNRSRITSDTVNTLFMIGDAKLGIMVVDELRHYFGEKIVSLFNGLDMPYIPYLIINQAFILDYDQVEAFKMTPFVYQYI